MRKLLTAAVLTAITLPAYADPYFMFGMGGAAFEIDDDVGQGIEEKSTAFTAGFGYTINDNIAIEVTHTDYEDVSGTALQDSLHDGTQWRSFKVDMCGDMETIAIAGKFMTTPENRARVYAKLGVDFWDADLKLKYDISGYDSFSISGSDSGADLFGAIGLDILVSDTFTLNLEYALHTVEAAIDIDGNDEDIDIDWGVLNFGVAFKF